MIKNHVRGMLPTKPRVKRLSVADLTKKLRPIIRDMAYNNRFSIEELNRYKATYGDMKQALHILEREGLIYRGQQRIYEDWEPKYWRRR